MIIGGFIIFVRFCVHGWITLDGALMDHRISFRPDIPDKVDLEGLAGNR